MPLGSIIGLACLLVGLFLQFWFGIQMTTGIVGAVLAMFGPALACLIPSAKPAYTGSNKPVWKTFTAEQARQYLDAYADELYAATHRSSWEAFLRSKFAIVVAVLFVIAGIYFYVHHDPVFGSVYFSIVAIPYGLFAIRNGRLPARERRGPSDDTGKREAIRNVLARMSMYSQIFEMFGMLEIKRGNPSCISDMAAAIRYRCRYNGVIGSKIAVAKHDNKNYLYFVLITKGTGPFRLEEEIEPILKDTHFSLERKGLDGNTAFIVFNGGIRGSCTSDDEIKTLLGIVSRLPQCLEKCCGV